MVRERGSLRRSICVERSSFDKLCGRRAGAEELIEYTTPTEMQAALHRAENEYVSLSQAPTGALPRLKRLCTSAGRDELSAQGLGLVSTGTFRLVRGMGTQRNEYISKELLALLAQFVVKA